MIDDLDIAIDVFGQRRHYFDYRCRREIFVHQIEAHLQGMQPRATVLDIGCGRGMDLDAAPQLRIAKLAERYWGVEPDAEVSVDSCFDNVWRSSLEGADIPAGSVDFAYSYMVLEHVTNPEGFMEKLGDILRPGGVFLGLTINRHSSLAQIATVCRRLRMQEVVLRLARGTRQADEYHYPAVYQMNTERRLCDIAARAGLDAPQIAYLERGEWEVYFPLSVRWVGRCMTKLVSRYPKFYTHLLVRITKSSACHGAASIGTPRSGRQAHKKKARQ